MIRLPRGIFLILNILLYQAGWLACVLAAAHGSPVLGVLVAAALLALHLALSPAPQRDVLLAAIFVGVGLLVDSSLALSGWLVFQSPGPVAALTPPWLLAIWGLFAITLHASLGWLQGRYLLAALLGAPAGALAYWAGNRLGAIEFPLGLVETLAVLALVWAAVVPCLAWIARRTAHGFPRPGQEATP